MEKHYKNEQVKTFALGPAQNLGLKADDLQFDVRFHEKRIELGFILRKDAPVDLGMKKGDRLVTAVSYRYTKEELEHILNQAFDNTTLWTSKHGKTVVAIATCRSS